MTAQRSAVTTYMPSITSPDKPTTAKQSEAARVARELEALCAELGVGARLPRHTELMQRLGASQYNVIRILENLQRAGRVVRRHGSGTYVIDPADLPVQNQPPMVEVGVTQSTIVAMSRPDGGYFDHCMELLYEETRRRGFGLACHFLSVEGIERADPVAFGRPAGFIVFRRDLAALGRELQRLGSRVVLVGAPHVGESFGVPCVCGNHERGAYLVTNHLIDLGHRNIAFADMSGTLIAHARWQGHSKMIADATRSGHAVRHRMVDIDTIDSWRANAVNAMAYFTAPDAPTALVAWNDLEALELLAILGRAGLKVPADVTLVGYDNDDGGERVFPSLTTVDHLIGEQIAAAMDMLVDANAPSANERLIFAPTLVVRESSGNPAV